MTAPDHRRIRSNDLLHRRGHPHMTHWSVLSGVSPRSPGSGRFDSTGKITGLASILRPGLCPAPATAVDTFGAVRLAAERHFFPVFDVGALECPLFLSATASPLSVRSTLWAGWPPTISQPFCAARVMALLSISSSFTLMNWESMATEAHCDRLPSMIVCAALQMRTARGS